MGILNGLSLYLIAITSLTSCQTAPINLKFYQGNPETGSMQRCIDGECEVISCGSSEIKDLWCVERSDLIEIWDHMSCEE